MHRILRRDLLSEESLLPHYDDISHRFRSLIYDLTTFRLGCNPGRAILLRLGLSLFPSSWFRLPFLIIPLFFFLVSPLAGQSQTLPQAEISGTVTDQTGAAISGAEVTFTADSFSATQVTNDWGKFTFSNVPVEAGVARASADGFQVNTADWRTGSGPLQIVLLPATAAEQVTVTANRTGVRVVENATSVTILSGPDIEATAAFRLDDMLRQVPGFSLFRRTTSRSANPTTQGVSLRGLGASGASRALVLSDGFPLNDPFGGWVYWDRAPRESIQSLEVASGGASHLYGSDALGGVINIIRSPVNQDAVSLEAAYGNENSPDLSLAASKTLGPWSFGIASELFRTDGYIAVPADLRGAVDTPVNSQDATGDVTVRRQFGDRGSIFVRGSVFGESRHNGTPLQTNSTTIRELDLGGNWDAHEIGAFQLRAYAGRQNLDQSFSSIAADRNTESLTRTQRVPAQQVGFSVQWQHSMGTRQNLVAGLEESNIHGQTNEQGYFGGHPTSTSAGGGREVNWGAYVEDIIRITPSWLLTASGRVDHWMNFDAFAPPNPAVPVGAAPVPDRSESFFSPRLALSAQAHEQCFSHRFRLPRVPRAHSERTVSRVSRRQCFYRSQFEPSRRTADWRRRRRHRHRLEPAPDAAWQFFLEPDHAARGQCHPDHHSQPDHPAAPESGQHSFTRRRSGSQRTGEQLDHAFGRLRIHSCYRDQFHCRSCSGGTRIQAWWVSTFHKFPATSSISRPVTHGPSFFSRSRDASAGTSSTTTRTPYC